MTFPAALFVIGAGLAAHTDARVPSVSRHGFGGWASRRALRIGPRVKPLRRGPASLERCASAPSNHQRARLARTRAPSNFGRVWHWTDPRLHVNIVTWRRRLPRRAGTERRLKQCGRS
jgi:hypothetical protein